MSSNPTSKSSFEAALHFSEEVKSAIADKLPIVALESTIITHGMPWPENVSTAREVEATIRANGAVPATLAVLAGRVHVGLDDKQLEELAQTDPVLKLSRADLAACVAAGHSGSTTVAATMILADLVGIKVFATGGIGGVHRDVNETLDISADLNELSRTNVNVVCAGAKAILDLAKTFEYLETLGVPVVGWQCDELPAFWSRQSGLDTPLRFDQISELVSFIELRQSMRLDGGVLIANPVPLEAEIPAAEMSQVIEDALIEARQQRISGKAVTPFLLSFVLAHTEGRSLATNIALVKNNASLAAKLATEL